MAASGPCLCSLGGSTTVGLLVGKTPGAHLVVAMQCNAITPTCMKMRCVCARRLGALRPRSDRLPACVVADVVLAWRCLVQDIQVLACSGAFSPVPTRPCTRHTCVRPVCVFLVAYVPHTPLMHNPNTVTRRDCGTRCLRPVHHRLPCSSLTLLTPRTTRLTARAR